jgi:hypothetical protein
MIAASELVTQTLLLTGVGLKATLQHSLSHPQCINTGRKVRGRKGPDFIAEGDGTGWQLHVRNGNHIIDSMGIVSWLWPWLMVINDSPLYSCL